MPSVNNRSKQVNRTNRLIACVGMTMPFVYFEPAIVDLLMVVSSLYLALYFSPTRKTITLLAVYWLGTVASILVGMHSVYFEASSIIRYVLIELLLSLAFIYFACASASLKFSNSFMKWYTYGAVFSCVVVLVFLNFNILSDIIFRDAFRIRVKGFFKDPNVLGPYLVAPILVLLFARKWCNIPRSITVFCIPLALLLFITYSRGAYVLLLLSLSVSMCLILVVEWRKYTLFTIPATIIFAVAAYHVLDLSLIANIESKYAYRLSLQDYDSDRFYHIKNGASLMFTDPFGVGPSLYGLQYFTNPHNLFVGKFTDSGIVSAIIIVTIPVYATICSLRYYFNSKDRISLVIGATLLGHLVISMIVYSHHWRHLIFLSALAIGQYGFRSNQRK